MTKRKKILLLAGIYALFIAAALCLYFYRFFAPAFNISQTVYVYVDRNKNFSDILAQLDTTAHIRNMSLYKQTAAMFHYPEHIKSGRYAVSPSTSLFSLVRTMRSGLQTPVELKFNSVRTKAELCEKIGKQLMLDADTLKNRLSDSLFCRRYGFDTATVCCMFIPNTYQFYWDISLPAFFDKIKNEYSHFWNADRLKKAEKQKLSPIEVSILASIVEGECLYRDEYPAVAGLYLNRLHRGILLQADPTVIFANGDFTLQRVLYRHLASDSPYNTYRYKGLPPGPIRIPCIAALESVLNPQQHDNIFMCAKADFSGRHNFSASSAQHEQYRQQYIKALNERKIK